MAIKAAPGYGGQTLKNTIGSPIQIEQPITGVKQKVTGGSSLADAITGGASTPNATLGTNPIGTGKTTTTTVTPLQVTQDDILGDPNSQAALGQFTANTGNLALARAAAIRSAIVNAGWVPTGDQLANSGLASYAGDLTPDAIAQAQQNPMSQAAQLKQQLTQAQTNLPYDLAASGLDRSGALTIGQSGLSQQYDTASYQGLQDLLGSITGAANTYASSYNDALTQLANARLAVAQNLAQNAGSTTVTTESGGDDGSGSVDTSPNNPAGPGTPPPPIYQTVQKVINSLKQTPKTDPRIYQDVRNIRAG